MDLRIVDLTTDHPAMVDQAAELLHDAFRNRTEDWSDGSGRCRCTAVTSGKSIRLSSQRRTGGMASGQTRATDGAV